MVPLFSAFSRMSAIMDAAWLIGSSETLFSMKAFGRETCALAGEEESMVKCANEGKTNLGVMRNFDGARLLRPWLSIDLDGHCGSDLNLYMMPLS